MTTRRVNEAAIEKAVFNLASLSSGGLLNAEQSDAFIDLIIDQPTIVNEARVVRMRSDTRKVEKIGFGSRILGPATEATDPGTQQAPTTSTVTLNAKELIAVIRITDDSIENNIEGEAIEDTIMRLAAERVALDMEELIINGDTGSADAFLAVLNGLREQITTNVVDANGGVTYKDYLKNARKALPSRFIRDARQFRFYTSYDFETEWVDAFGARATTGGDSSLANGVVPPAYGVPVRGIAMLQDYNITTPVSATVQDVILINPQNIILGISRDIRVETERLPKLRVTDIVITLKMDVKMEEENAAVKVIEVQA